jgi:hypothetical protein
MWLFREAGKGKIPIINYSGGTEVSGGILMGNVLTSLKPAAFSGPSPGMAADVVDIVRKGRHPLKGFDARIVAERAQEPPTRVVRAQLHFQLRGECRGGRACDCANSRSLPLGVALFVRYRSIFPDITP